MPSAGTTRPALSDAELVEMLALVEQADSVELKLTIPDEHQRSVVSALEMDPLDAQIRQVFFFDTPDLALHRAGIVARARRVQAREDDSVVKLRPVVPAELPAELRESRSLVVEVDAMPGGYVCSATMKGQPRTPVRETVAGEHDLRKLFTKEQRAFFSTYAPAGVELGQLSVLGPIFVLKLKFSPAGYGRRLVAELWFYPDGSRILELSTKSSPSEAFQVAAETRGFLAERGIDLTGEQQTKTRTALEFFTSSPDSEEGRTGR
jgi:hypothetical protein